MAIQFNRPLILASQSPRRSQLLKEAGFRFKVQAFDVDESFPDDMPAKLVAPWLAQKKAKAAAHLIENDEIVLAADSTVVLRERIYNKPANYAEAFRILRALSSQQHTVVTGVCLLAKEKETVFAEHTEVWFDELSDEEIDYYIRHWPPFDKAGAYGAQDWIGHCKIARIEGTFQNVMGLPVNLVYAALKNF